MDSDRAPSVDLTGSGAGPLGPGDPPWIGQYRIAGVLGTGGMGRVYLGLDPSGRCAAVKLVLPHLAEDQRFLEHFGHELDNLARLPPGLSARLLASERAARPPWFATEYVPGLTLSQALAFGGAGLPPADLWLLVREVARSLDAMHPLGMVHRDMKPSNVMLTLDGLKVIDFGVARAADQSRLTLTGQAVGTPAYMAPEQAMADKQLTGAVDVFALGGLVCYAAYGEPPFGDGAGPDVLFRVVYSEPELGRLHAVDPELARLVAACLVKDPAARPTAAQLVGWAGAKLPPAPAAGPFGSQGQYWPAVVRARIAERVAFAEAMTRIGTPPAPPTRNAFAVAEPFVDSSQPPLYAPLIVQPPIAQPPFAQPAATFPLPIDSQPTYAPAAYSPPMAMPPTYSPPLAQPSDAPVWGQPSPEAVPTAPGARRGNRTAGLVVASVAAVCLVAGLIVWTTHNSSNSNNLGDGVNTTAPATSAPAIIPAYTVAPTETDPDITPEPTEFDATTLNDSSTDQMPFTAAALLPQTFTDSENVQYTLVASGEKSCIAPDMSNNIQDTLSSDDCTASMTGSYLESSGTVTADNDVLVSVQIFPFDDSATAEQAYTSFQGFFNSHSWDFGFWCPTSGTGHNVCGNPGYQSAEVGGSIDQQYRYVVEASAVYTDLSDGTSTGVWTKSAAAAATSSCGPSYYVENQDDQ